MRNLKHILLCAILLTGSAAASDQGERKIVRREPPAYPTLAARLNLHGRVKLKIWINPDGTVRRLDYIGGHPLLAEAALKAVKAWKYESQVKESTSVVELEF